MAKFIEVTNSESGNKRLVNIDWISQVMHSPDRGTSEESGTWIYIAQAFIKSANHAHDIITTAENYDEVKALIAEANSPRRTSRRLRKAPSLRPTKP